VSEIDPQENVEVRRERGGKVALVVINRPQVRNAIDADTTHQLEEAFNSIEADTAVRATVLTGAGDTAFSAGMDLKAFAHTGVRGMATKHGGFAGVTRRRFTKPVIAAVNGSALGGGLEIALACDLIVASADAVFGLPEVKRGLIAGAGGLIRLPQRVPLGVALQMALTGEALGAAAARDAGLVSAVHPPAELLERALDLAEVIAKNAPLALAMSREVILGSIGASEESAWRQTDDAFRVVGASQDAKEGALAFAQRREPRWTGA
jgi:enoyl-CoA hydratase